jgi:hypothetical protein
MAWVPGLRRPALGPRIGIAAHYVTAVGDFTGSPQPIGSTELQTALDAVAQNSKQGGQRAGGGEVSDAAGGYGGVVNAGGDATKGAEDQLAFYAGEFGQNFSCGKAKIDSGEWRAQRSCRRVARPPQTVDPTIGRSQSAGGWAIQSCQSG